MNDFVVGRTRKDAKKGFFSKQLKGLKGDLKRRNLERLSDGDFIASDSPLRPGVTLKSPNGQKPLFSPNG